mmetsp:Transcript_22274/g.66860  ORF Transcript_22274/g.66860 Transcript_22274/m.66860 type:complete len:530 (-) Transcript_22274:48-1637(-)
MGNQTSTRADDSTRRPSKGRSERRVRIEAPAAEVTKKEEPSRQVMTAPPPDNYRRLKADYLVEKKVLGEGHYGVVRRCSPRSDPSQKFAVKSITKSRVSRPEMLKREVEILTSVKHPNIVEIVAVYDEPHYLHIVSELCTGGELFERIIAKSASAEKHFSESDAARILDEVLGAVAYCHGLDPPVAHRDLKPENFLFKTPSDSSPVKIIDFGLSRVPGQGTKASPLAEKKGTMHTRVGTPYYIAPEVLKRDYTLMCDMWSIGVIAYILLCGYPPFYGDNDRQIFKRVSEGRFTFPSPEWDHISRDARDFVSRLLALDPAKRPTAEAARKHRWIVSNRGGAAAAPAAPRPADPHVLAAVARRMGRFVAMGKLKRLALNLLSHELSGPELKELRRVFEQIDRDRSGKISTAELRDALRPHLAHREQSGGFDAKDRDAADELMRAVDVSGDEEIDYSEFMAATMQRQLYLREENIRKVFAHLDLDETGEITVANLVQITGSEKHAMELLGEADLDDSKTISYDEFKHLMKQS